MQAAVDRIRAERHRQIETEGYKPQKDLGREGELLAAAVGYIQAAGCEIPDSSYPSWVANDPDDPAFDWPWAKQYWKPSGVATRDLIKAGALIAAAIEALDSKEKTHE